jgi:hypothetical protein
MRLDNVGIKIALVLSLLLPAAFGQIDIPITQSGPYRTLARNVNWSQTGRGGIENNFIFTPVTTNESLCLSLSNTSGSTQSLTMSVYGTEDQTVSAYQTNQTAWTLLGPTAGIPLLSGATILTNNQVKNYFVQINSQARVAVVIANNAGSPTAGATLVSVESPLTSGCGNMSVNPINCPYVGAESVAAGVTVPLVNGQASQRAYICNFSASTDAANGAASTSALLINASTNANCIGGSTLPVFQVSIGTVTLNPPYIFAGNPLVGGFYSNSNDLAGDALCFTNNLSVPVVINYTFAQF